MSARSRNLTLERRFQRGPAYFTGGLLSLTRGKREEPEPRPTLKRPTSPTEPHRQFVGTGSGDTDSARADR
jgi:hypothetical protein